jgi:hypothetical protein
MTQPNKPLVSQRAREAADHLGRKFARGCGYTCPYRDWINGTCDKHGPSQLDLTVQRLADRFSRELRAIMRDNRDE